MSNPTNEIIKFNIDRNLVSFNSKVEYNLLFEELQEFQAASGQENEYEIVDSLCDLVVVAIGALYKLGYHPDKALLETTKEILSRKGAINPVTGKWEKYIDQDLSTLYKANYTNSKR